ncbi:MAG: cell division protein ZipA C-terminal FtsZ-binding domain-containing protein [Methylotenera sp.]|uniref:cell division protein ZipA C-terminal FtsZ-binding domain-containing protein n=1 Tax=Methylotenera sp. TaxID=2051956 RepID=UPI0027163860|nr:cell division protein ZipA C-terminal FtsZ-binding domain-containing protein [Methylotenera sp.]MDO9204700.1 cell division protein ZipA C-terminal FtsZ-binding domain-containing protein [Methylotenera sp.]MDO9392757.1 cell division protein ZipA C-terminal FtsZ-binding domain-containing protein [Methylotenera sp.]MDP1522823.1 cell division protein ZipA C-terminal FtsZ-binding domain-containing protein [Methylotenera sp.]
MSDLQIALIAIGALIILAVLIINWWQERRFHRQVEENFAPMQRDALLDDPALDTSDLNDTLSDRFDNRATDHFSIDTIPAEIATQQSAKYQAPVKHNDRDRFVHLTQGDASETALREDESIEATYNQLVNSKLEKSKLEKLSPNNAESIASHHQESVIKVNPEQTNAFRAVFDEEINPKNEFTKNNEVAKNTGASIEVNAQQKDTSDSAVSLPSMLHGQIDLTALLYLATETSVSTLNNALNSLFDDFDKPIFVHVLDSNKQWHLLKDLQSSQEALNQQISKVACSMQLADRGGAVTRNTLNRFQLAVETSGLDINGHVEWQGAGDALTAANALDLFCIEVDKTIGFHLVHGESGAFTGTKLRGLAESQGLKLTADGGFKYFDELSDNQPSNTQASLNPQLHPSFVMFNRDGNPFSPEMLRTSVVKGVTFQLDIPHVKQSAEVFSHMVQVARQMEIGLNSVLVDDNNRVLGDIQIEKIRQQLKVIQATMLVRGIVPGSDCAHRLFS